MLRTSYSSYYKKQLAGKFISWKYFKDLSFLTKTSCNTTDNLTNNDEMDLTNNNEMDSSLDNLANKENSGISSPTGDWDSDMILTYDSDMDIEFMFDNAIVDIIENNQGGVENIKDIQNVENCDNQDGEEIVHKTWSLNEEISLIDFYREHPSLFDIKSSDYKKSFKSSILEELADILNRKFTCKTPYN